MGCEGGGVVWWERWGWGVRVECGVVGEMGMGCEGGVWCGGRDGDGV